MKSRRHHLTLAYRLLLVFILTFSTVWPLAGPSTPLEAAPPDAPPTPALPVTPTPQPSEPGITPQGVTPPSPEDLPPEAEQARARQAMEAALAKHLRYWGPRYQVAPIEVAVAGEWAYGVAQWQSQAKTLGGPLHILARRLPGGTWQALLPDGEGLYRQWLEAMPERLVPAGEKSQLRAQAAEADALRRPQATTAVPPAPTAMPPGKEGPSGPVEPVPGLAQPTATPTPQATSVVPLAATAMPPGKEGPGEPVEPVPGLVQSTATSTPIPGLAWETYVTSEFGYSVKYPSKLQLRERNEQLKGSQGGVPSDLWFGERIHIITRIPPLPDDVFSSVWKDATQVELPQGLQALRLERVSEPIGGGTPLTNIEYLFRANGADFFLVYNPLTTTPADDQERQIFETMVTTFAVLPQRTYTPPITIQAAETDGFDFPVDPRDGSSGRPSGSNRYNQTGNGTKPDTCYGKPMWELQHAGEDWVRSAGSAVYAVANGQVIYLSSAIPPAGYPGGVVIIQHNLPSGVSNPWGGNLIFSMYGHVSPSVSLWKDVKRGDVIGTVSDQQWNSHIHFEMRRYGNMQQAPEWVNGYHFCNTSWPGPGYTDTGSNPDWFGYTHPSAWIDGHRPGGGGGTCSAPSLTEPPDGVTLNNRTITFRWNAVSGCTFNGYTLRVKNTSNMDSGGTTYLDRGIGLTEYTCTFDGSGPCGNAPENTDLYWGVRAANAPAGANWSVRRFRIVPGGGGYPTDHWHMEFFNNPDLNGGPACTNDSYTGLFFNQDWGGGHPSGCPIGDDNWSGRFTRRIDFGGGGSIHFDVDHDDGMRMWVGGTLVIDRWGQTGSTCVPWNAPGGWQDVKIEYRENGGGAHINVSKGDGGCVTVPNPPNLQNPGNGANLMEGQDITLAWSGNGDQYYAEYWGGPAGTINSGWQSGTSWHIGSQWAGYTYSWHVKARNSAGESGWSDTWTFTVRPAAPSNLSAQVASCHQINLTWSDNSGNEEGYRIYRNGSLAGQVGANTTSYQDPGLGENTDYSYYVRAFRGSIESNDSNTVNVHTPPCPTPTPVPDLMPSQWGGWQYPIVPSSVTGTNVVNTLYAGLPTYIDWGITNFGNANTGGNTYGDLYIDSTRLAHYNFGDVWAGYTWAFFDWMEVVNTPGWHTLRSVADPGNLIAESDETNNVWERQFYWTPSAPYSDSMENSVNGWTATGLWHQVSSSSPYPDYHSPTHSWWYGQDSTGNYDTGSANSGDLTSPSIYIPASGYYLRFWYRYETETQSQNWDQRWLQISVDGGPFNNVLQLYDDPMNWWLQSQAINLSGYAGHTIQVRFHFDTFDGASNAYRGWYIDDLDISSTPPPSCADGREPNNTPAQATSIAYGQTRNADICPGGDYDYYKFTGTAGDRVVVDVDAKVNGSLLDSYVFLLDSDGTSVLAENDDEITIEVQDSHFGYQLPHNGTYYIKVRAWDHPSAGGAGYFYTIRLLKDNTNPSIATVTSPSNDAWLDPNLQTIAVSANDNESGISRVEFWWHSADWQNSGWAWLGADQDGRNGWSWNFDTSGLAEQRGGAFYIFAFDWANNWTGAAVWNLGLDRTPPTTSAGINPMYGDAPFLDFYVWWSGSDNLSGIDTYDVQYRDGSGGTWTDLLTGTTDTYYRFVGQNGHTYYFRARARDVTGNQSTYSGGNGDAQRTVQICATSADSREPDNNYTAAKTITTDGVAQSHNFHAAGDQDWLKFAATAGIIYTLVTTNTGGHADTTVSLYASDGSTLLAFNDDDPDNWPASRLEWGANQGGTYYVKVEHWDPYAYGCTTAYKLSIAETGSFKKVFLPIILKNAP